MSINRIILSTGGTGGHIFPAVSVAQEIIRRNPSAMILFLGAKDGPEADIVVKTGFSFAGLPVRGIMGKGVRGVLNGVAMVRGITTAFSIIHKVKPQLVVGFGGYAAFAGTLAGRLCGKLTAIHEQNSIPGMANKLLGKITTRVFLSLADSACYFSAPKTLLSGNPIRADIAALAETFEDRLKMKQESGHPPRLLVMGGSLGAAALNTALIDTIGKFVEKGIEVWHQTGKDGYDTVRHAYRLAGVEQVRVEAFITDMAQAYGWADLALCRAGASSLAELTAAGVPAVLVPYPYAAQDHQRHNARALETAGGAIILEQERFSGNNAHALPECVLPLLEDKERLLAMARAGHALAKPYAAVSIVDELEKLLSR